MIHLKAFNEISDPLTHNDNINYDSEWKLPTSQIRSELTRDIREILLDITDIGYRVDIGGFITNRLLIKSSPYIWICNKNSGRSPIILDEIDESIKRVCDFLEREGFTTKIKRINANKSSDQIYIYFEGYPLHYS